eukprot:TRINITY_DN35428_c0_g1_i1.p1 TRINITY_DN35428_c0_g1~~TRINITY_DN35428_c0_g1_i1.p1  ORF type:complete len:263 (+),score=55.05 TRINITY_DN35428_c0_g1_i1:182-970(+)
MASSLVATLPAGPVLWHSASIGIDSRNPEPSSSSVSDKLRKCQRSLFYGAARIAGQRRESGEDRAGVVRGRSLTIRAISSNEFRPGVSIELDNAPWRVQEFLHVKPGKGAAFVRTKLRNYITGNTVERTFRAGENVDEATVVKDVKQYTYSEGNQFVFMDMATFEEIRMDAKALGDGIKWLKEGMECNVLTWKDRVIDVELPINVRLLVTEAEPGLKGDTAGSGATKSVKVETGATVNVPLFVEQDNYIVVDTRTGNYMSRG